MALSVAHISDDSRGMEGNIGDVEVGEAEGNTEADLVGDMGRVGGGESDIEEVVGDYVPENIVVLVRDVGLVGGGHNSTKEGAGVYVSEEVRDDVADGTIGTSDAVGNKVANGAKSSGDSEEEEEEDNYVGDELGDGGLVGVVVESIEEDEGNSRMEVAGHDDVDGMINSLVDVANE